MSLNNSMKSDNELKKADMKQDILLEILEIMGGKEIAKLLRLNREANRLSLELIEIVTNSTNNTKVDKVKKVLEINNINLKKVKKELEDKDE